MLNDAALGRVTLDIKGKKRKNPKGDKPGQVRSEVLPSCLAALLLTAATTSTLGNTGNQTSGYVYCLRAQICGYTRMHEYEKSWECT